MNSWKVYIGSKVINIVYFSKVCDAWDVRNSLINHDGFPSTIHVVKEKK